MTVLKQFNTRLRRFFAGDPVSPEDDLSPHTFDGLVRAGYIEKPARKPRKK